MNKEEFNKYLMAKPYLPDPLDGYDVTMDLDAHGNWKVISKESRRAKYFSNKLKKQMDGRYIR